MAESNYDLVDLHKIFVDEITLVSSGKPMKREADLIDVWFDGSTVCTMALSFENKDKIDKTKIFQLIYCRRCRSNAWLVLYLTRYWNLSFDKVAYKM
jgi:isoleucyl-tRNA synthetase